MIDTTGRRQNRADSSSSKKIAIHAPAKLNLFLEVLAKRDDGYHELETLMTAISIFDTITISPNIKGRIQLTCRWAWGLQARASAQRAAAKGRSVSFLEELPRSEENLVVRALELFRKRAGVEAGACVELVKRIPSSAGLGGASSDAAAALVAANELWSLGWSPGRLADFSAELGSDIPFFIGASGAGAAICRGRGEWIEPIIYFPKTHFVVVRPPGGLSTAEVYQNCQAAKQPSALSSILAGVRKGDMATIGRNLTNRLQESAEKLSPWIGRLKKEFNRLDFLGHQMSGSGTSYFGVCKSARQARCFAKLLCSRGWPGTFCASSIPPLSVFH